MEPIIQIESLQKYYGKSATQTKALNGITFQVMPGEFLGIMGSSGSGKSTLLNCIATVIKPTGGTITMRGLELQSLGGRQLSEYRGKNIGYLFQNFELLDGVYTNYATTYSQSIIQASVTAPMKPAVVLA